MIAGATTDSFTWTPLLPLLTNRFDLIMPDNRGSGRTKVAGPLSIADMVEDCMALLDHLGIERANVFGHSMGGMIARRLALTHPVRVRRLIAMASTDHLPNKTRMLFHELALLKSELPPVRRFGLFNQFIFSPAFFADTAMVLAGCEAAAAYPWRQSAADFVRQVEAVRGMEIVDQSRIACPVLALIAGEDQLILRGEIEESHDQIPGIRYVTIAGVGHAAHWEEPEAVTNAIVEFFA